jgi:hypothetical protein
VSQARWDAARTVDPGAPGSLVGNDSTDPERTYLAPSPS